MSIFQADIIRLTGKDLSTEKDVLAVEEPLEIRLSFTKDFKRVSKTISITMRTPGNDEELALGFLFTEGIIKNIAEVNTVTSGFNITEVVLNDFVEFEMKNLERHFYTSSSCGICGKTSIAAINTINQKAVAQKEIQIDSDLIKLLPSLLRKKQNIFEKTGGLHASAVYDLYGGNILLNEDIGRHNALDKIIGTAMKIGMLPLDKHILLLSGRASFELIQKATMAEIPIVASVGAPSSLAVQLAEERGMTLIGFLKQDRFNIYSGIERIRI